MVKQFVGKKQTNFLSVFDYFVGLLLKGLNTPVLPSVEMAESEMQIFAYCWIWLSLWQMIYTGNYSHLKFNLAHTLWILSKKDFPYVLKHFSFFGRAIQM